MRQWVAGITAASLLSAVAMALTPRGRVRQVTRLVCGLMCALAVAAPAVRLDFSALASGLAVYEQRAREITSQAEEEAKMLDRTYIEDRYEAYILTKAAQLDAALEGVTVTARWDEREHVWYPWSAALEGAYHGGLSAVLEGELGIPGQRQSWREDG